MQKTCYEIQKEILQQKTATEVFNEQIDIHLEEATSNLKKLIIQEHFLSQRLLITELFCSKQIKNPLELSTFTATENDVQVNFASLDLPDDISKNPIKAFLNNLFDNLDTFLPTLGQLTNENLNNIANSSLQASPTSLLLQCVFPSLFGYCWSEEASISYGHYLATWFDNNFKSNPDLLKGFESHWLSQAIRGYFSSIDIYPFVNTAISPIFFDFIQLDSKTDQLKPEILIDYAIRLINSIHENYSMLPNCLNSFFNEIFSSATNDEDQSKLIQLIFFEILISPFLKNPILYSVSDVLLPTEDYSNFSKIYDIFSIKFNTYSDNSTFSEQITTTSKYSNFDPFIIKEDIINKKASYTLPLLQEFCSKVQCAHHPLLLTTHYLAVLFRFSESLLQSKMLPKSLERPLNTILQDSIPERLEEINDFLFWFPCYSLTYLNVPPVSFHKESKTSSLYRLLSSNDLRISPLDTDFVHALSKAGEAATLTTHPELRTEVQWLLKSNGGGEDSLSFLPSIEQEISVKLSEIEQKRTRCLDLVCFAETVQEKFDSLPSGPLMALASELLPDFKNYSKVDIFSTLFMTNIRGRIKDYCSKAFPVIGKFLADAILVEVLPFLKSKCSSSEKVEREVGSELEFLLIEKPIVVSSCFSIAKKLIPSLYTISEFEDLTGEECVIKKIADQSFIEFAEKIANEFVSLLFPLPSELLTLAFSMKDLELLKIFSNIFNKKK